MAARYRLVPLESLRGHMAGIFAAGWRDSGDKKREVGHDCPNLFLVDIFALFTTFPVDSLEFYRRQYRRHEMAARAQRIQQLVGSRNPRSGATETYQITASRFRPNRNQHSAGTTGLTYFSWETGRGLGAESAFDLFCLRNLFSSCFFFLLRSF